MSYPFRPPPDESPDDSPVDPNPGYAELSYPDPAYFGPPSTGQYIPPQTGPHPPPAAPPPDRYPPPWDSGRPNGVLAAGVLAYIDAGLLILAGLLLLVGASAVDGWNQAFGSSDNGFTAELATDGLINMVSAGLQIAGGVLLAARSERGRTLLSIGGGICIASGVYWLLRVHDAGVIVWTALFVGLPIVGMSLAWSGAATAWLRGERSRRART